MLDMEGHGHEDDGDHMTKFFKPSGKASVEVNKRTILADIAMADGQYEGKKVTRAELLKDNVSEDEDEDAMESGEMEMEEGESEMSQSSSESVEMPVQGGVDSDDEVTQRNKKLLQKLEANHEGSDEELDAALDMVVQAKTEESKITQTKQATDVEKAEAVQTQKKVFNTILQQRILMQKMLIASNKLPQRESLKLFAKSNEMVQESAVSCKRSLKKFMKELQSVQSTMFKLSETKIELAPVDTEGTSN